MFRSMENLIWFEGVVESRDDPLKLGRVQVRCIGIHSSDKSQIPTEDLHWAQVSHPITSAALSGIGHTPALLPGTHVIGFFRDGVSSQDPIVMGSIGGIPLDAANGATGFNDPSGEFPRYTDEPDTSRLARAENISKTNIPVKNKNAKTGIERSNDKGTWDEPAVSYNAQYPFNKVHETESGHVIEYDDTPGAERLHIFHKSGTYTEIDVNGTSVSHIVGDKYEILDRNGKLYITGDYDVTVDGSSSLYVKNVMQIQVDGDCNAIFKNDVNAEVYGNMQTSVQGDFDFGVVGNITYRSDGKIIMTSANGIDIKTPGKVNIGGSTGVNIDGAAIYENTGMTQGSHSPVGKVGSRASPSGQSLNDLEINGMAASIEFDYDSPDDPRGKEYSERREALGLPPEPEMVSNDMVESTEEIAVPDAATTTNPVSCDEFILNEADIKDSTQLSANYNIGELTTGTALRNPSHVLSDNVGISKGQIACNLKQIAENVLEPIKAQYPNMFVTSGFRRNSGSSQHNSGEAADIQFSGIKKTDYLGIAVWIQENVTHDQILLEFSNSTNNPWIHVSYAASGKQRGNSLTLLNNSTYPQAGAKGKFYQLEPLA